MITNMLISISCIHIHIYTYVNNYIYNHFCVCPSVYVHKRGVYICAQKRVSIYMYICVCKRIFLCMYTCVYIFHVYIDIASSSNRHSHTLSNSLSLSLLLCLLTHTTTHACTRTNTIIHTYAGGTGCESENIRFVAIQARCVNVCIYIYVYIYIGIFTIKTNPKFSH